MKLKTRQLNSKRRVLEITIIAYIFCFRRFPNQTERNPET